MALQLSTTARNALLDSLTTSVGSAGYLRIYDGTMPATVADSITGTLLAELVLATPFAAAASSGVLTLGTITQDSSANATGTATHFRIYKSDGTTAVMQGDVSTSGAILNLSTVSIVTGNAVSITSFVITAPGA